MLKTIDTIIETDKPILIEGWGKVKKMYPKQKITNKVIDENIFWTFSEKEKRTENNLDLENFKNYCFKKIESKYKYFFINPMEISFSKIKKIINKIDSIDEKIYWFHKKHFFILVENVVFGINLDFLLLGKITENKLKKWLNLKNFVFFEDDKIFNIKDIIDKNREYLIPALKQNIKYEKEFIIGYILK